MEKLEADGCLSRKGGVRGTNWGRLLRMESGSHRSPAINL